MRCWISRISDLFGSFLCHLYTVYQKGREDAHEGQKITTGEVLESRKSNTNVTFLVPPPLYLDSLFSKVQKVQPPPSGMVGWTF